MGGEGGGGRGDRGKQRRPRRRDISWSPRNLYYRSLFLSQPYLLTPPTRPRPVTPTRPHPRTSPDPTRPSRPSPPVSLPLKTLFVPSDIAVPSFHDAEGTPRARKSPDARNSPTPPPVATTPVGMILRHRLRASSAPLPAVDRSPRLRQPDLRLTLGESPFRASGPPS